MLITASQLIRGTLHLYWDHFGTMLHYLLLMLFVWALMAVNGVIGLSFAMDSLGPIGGWVIAILQFVIIGIFFWISIAFTRTISTFIRQETPISMSNQLKASKSLFFPTLLTSIMVGAAVFFGTLLLIIPGIVFSIWYYFAVYATMVDGQKSVAAFKTSKALVNGRFGQVFWRLVAPIALYLIIFSAGMWSILTPGQYFLAATGSLPTYWLAIVLGIIFYFLLIPIITITPILLYENLKKTPTRPEEA